MENLYTSNKYYERNVSMHMEHSAWKAKQIVYILKRNMIHPISICEIGCGSGEILFQLHRNYSNNIEYTGYEISSFAYNKCLERNSCGINFVLGKFEDKVKEKYDVVMAIDVIEHVENIYDFLRRIKLIGNLKIFHIPLDLSVQSLFRIKPIIKCRKEFGHIHYFNKELALETLEDSGHNIIDFFYTKRMFELTYSGLKPKLMKIPRKILYKLNNDIAVRLLGGFSIIVLTE